MDAHNTGREVSLPPEGGMNNINIRYFEGTNDFHADNMSFTVAGGDYYAVQPSIPHRSRGATVNHLGINMSICRNATRVTLGSVKCLVAAGNIYGGNTNNAKAEPIVTDAMPQTDPAPNQDPDSTNDDDTSQ